MRTQLLILAALFVGCGPGLAQQQTPNNSSGAPSATHPQTATPDRPPATAMPEANRPTAETTGQAPAASEKMEPGMDTPAGPKTAPCDDGHHLRITFRCDGQAE